VIGLHEHPASRKEKFLTLDKSMSSATNRVPNRREVFLFVSTRRRVCYRNRQCRQKPRSPSTARSCMMPFGPVDSGKSWRKTSLRVLSKATSFVSHWGHPVDGLPTADPSSQLPHRERYSERLGHFRVRVPGCIKRLPGVATSNFNQLCRASPHP